jgi:hypothetical protein
MAKRIGAIEYGIFLAYLQYCKETPKAIPRADVELAMKNSKLQSNRANQ